MNYFTKDQIDDCISSFIKELSDLKKFLRSNKLNVDRNGSFSDRIFFSSFLERFDKVRDVFLGKLSALTLSREKELHDFYTKNYSCEVVSLFEDKSDV